MTIRIQGVVRAARSAHQRLRAGIPKGEREAFLDGLRDSVARIEEICARDGADSSALPTPSRRAFGDLKALAALSADLLPEPRADVPAPRRMRISNVVSSRDRVLDLLARAEPAGADVDRALAEARACVADVERICRAGGSEVGALPDRTGEAYALLRWIASAGNVEVWLDRRDVFAGAFSDAVRSGPAAAAPGFHEAAQGKAVRVRFLPGRRVFQVRQRETELECLLNVGFLGASDQDLCDLAVYMLERKLAPVDCAERHAAFVDSETYGALTLELQLYRGARPAQAAGRVRDLDAMFQRLNREYFDGCLERPALDWHDGVSLRQFGFYVASMDRVCVDGRLDREDVPEFVAEFILFHELLHKKHGIRHEAGRHRAHTPAFRADERRYPRYAEARRWLSALASGASEPSVPASAAPRPASPARSSTLDPSWGAALARQTCDASPPYGMPTSTPRPGRNERCWCGSGRKYKRCHLDADRRQDTG